MDLVRKMLISIEDYEHGFAPKQIVIDNYTQDQIGYHATILIESGLVLGHESQARGAKSPYSSITRLTWAGHEFLDTIREPSRWQQAKDMIQKAGGASLSVWGNLLTEILKKNLGI